MVENEAHLGTAPHHLDRVRKLVMIDADVERKIVARQQFQRLDQLWPQHESGIGLVLDQAPDAAHSLQLGDACNLWLNRSAAFERKRDDRAKDPGIRRR